jgi:hypothetical protein
MMRQVNGIRQLRWHYLSPVKTVLAAFIFVAAAWVLGQLRHPPHPERAPIAIPVARAFASAFAFIAFASVMRGGGAIDLESRQLTRWWGPFVPLWRRRIHFDSIRGVAVRIGTHTGSRPAARPSDQTYHVAVLSDEKPLLIRWTKSREDACDLARTISNAVGCPDQTLA